MRITPIRHVGPPVCLAVLLLVAGACGLLPTPVPVQYSGNLPTPVAALPNAPQTVSVPTLPNAVPSVRAPTSPLPTIANSLPTSTPLPPRQPQGDSPEATAILQRWAGAAQAIRTVRGSQQFTLVAADGTQHPFSEDRYMSIQGTEERYEILGPEQGRYYVAMHSKRGEFITLYDGQGAYRSWSWLNEIYRPWPDSSAQNAYWGDDIDDTALFNYLRPADMEYSVVGREELDGRQVVELVVKPGPVNIAPQGIAGTHVYLDEATSLPYRYVTQSSAVNGVQPPAVQRTFTKLEINSPMSNEDFKLDPPAGAVTIYEPAPWAAKMPGYSSLAEAQNQAETVLFAPAEGVQGDIGTAYFVEQAGKRLPVVALNNGSILEGVYIPQVADRFALRFSDQLGDEQITPIDIDGQPAEWRTGTGRGLRLWLTRAGTQIEIQASSQEAAIAIARSLQQVK